jgi:hypothetical protein
MNIKLTEPNPELAKMVRRTPHGMAYWAGTGPRDKFCAGCSNFGTIYPDGEGTRGKPDRCRLFYRQTGKVGGKLDLRTESCKYYSEH